MLKKHLKQTHHHHGDNRQDDTDYGEHQRQDFLLSQSHHAISALLKTRIEEKIQGIGFIVLYHVMCLTGLHSLPAIPP